jgi:hypothetical protein
LLTPSIVIVGLLNILVIGLFYVFAFKRKVTFTTYADKVVFYSNLLLMLVSLHYLSAILLYISECIFNTVHFLPALLIPDLGALFFWALLIYVVKKILLRRAQVKGVMHASIIKSKSPTTSKVIGFALLPVIAVAIYFAYPSIALKFSSNLKIKYTCDGGSYTKEYAVDVEKREVVVISKVFDEKNVLFSSNIRKLSDCIVVNSKNWTCGGKYNFGGYDATDKSIDGVYGYIRRTGEEPNSCKAEQLN